MSNESFDELIIKYNFVTPDAKNEEFGKLGVIEVLEDIEDNRVLPFYLKVLVDENEYDLARVEIAKILKFWQTESEENKQEIVQSLMLVLENSEDDYLVRQWVAIAICKYADIEGVFEFATKVILDREEDIAVRYNVLDIFEHEGSTERTLKVFKELLNDVEFEKTAARILKEWGQ